ncbi:DUF1761 domain-containing protein (plasmid) [Pseudoalteromonas sp. T1lg65]|uniref:DUF1761 domain-containing protein n=1 Tax=Pseudoalteromonas sp. T1lg65 TaxID=2077101 RepID=UPI003F79A41B
MVLTLDSINLWAVLLAALSSFMVGGIWYSPLLFQQTWMEGCGLTELDLKNSDPRLTFGVALLMSLLASLFMAFVLVGNTSLLSAGLYGFGVGTFFVSSALGISYIFEQRPLKLFLVNGGYHILQFTLISVVLGLMS